MELCIRNPGGSIPITDVFAGVDNAAARCNGAWEEVSHRAEGIRLGIAWAVFFREKHFVIRVLLFTLRKRLSCKL